MVKKLKPSVFEDIIAPARSTVQGHSIPAW